MPAHSYNIFIRLFSFIVIIQLLSHVWLFATHGLQHARLPCPPLPPSVCSHSCPLSQWCHPIISSTVDPFSSCPQSFPASMIQLFASGGQSRGTSASVLPMNIQLISFRTDWFDLLAQNLLQHHSLKASVLQCSAFFMVQLSHPYMAIGKATVEKTPILWWLRNWGVNEMSFTEVFLIQILFMATALFSMGTFPCW